MAAPDFWSPERLTVAAELGRQHGRSWATVATELSARWGVPLTRGAVKSAIQRHEGAQGVAANDTRPPSQARVSDEELAAIARKLEGHRPATSGTRLVRTLIVPDAHVPYHDRRAWALMLQAARVVRPERIVVLGDLLDFYCVSSHTKDPSRRISLEQEIEGGNEALDQLDALGARERILLAGNHETRLDRLLASRAPEIAGIVPRVAELLRLRERGWRHVEYRKSVRVGSLLLTHDMDQAGLHANLHARRKAEGDAVIGHTHRMAVTYLGDRDGVPSVGAMLGWLGDASAVDYRSDASVRYEWVHGFGVATDLPDGKTVIQPIPVFGGSCIVDGQLVTDNAIEAGRAA